MSSPRQAHCGADLRRRAQGRGGRPADAARETSADAVRELHDLGVKVVMLSGDNQATATRIADQLGIDTVIAEVLPGRQSRQDRRPAEPGPKSRHGRRRRQRRPRSGPG